MDKIWAFLLKLVREKRFELIFETDVNDKCVNGHFNVRAFPASITLANTGKDLLEDVITLSHEIGHLIHMREFSSQAAYQKAYDENVLELEWKAWEYAEKILKQTDFNRWDEFISLRESSYQTYKMSPEELLLYQIQRQ